jgi:hypothetical protein
LLATGRSARNHLTTCTKPCGDGPHATPDEADLGCAVSSKSLRQRVVISGFVQKLQLSSAKVRVKHKANGIWSRSQGPRSLWNSTPRYALDNFLQIDYNSIWVFTELE